ncbi:methyltransferase domain-containing protein [Streptomyces sp. NBC_00201]|uniref:methyltransferase domain-containing protein n=1 Tax=Streptomyces sp. NBC_00201 TaxID=2975679 RepID=UPI00225A64AA|nr:methyltransferase domain-containing protein [Streptomyces sp. NBC_00201]MCX5247148.1 methyltransferase domain-containing protein [Streptomyces sp. NBC_00201]
MALPAPHPQNVWPTVGEVDRVVPQGRWTFGPEVTSVFDNMLARSIPQYEVMRHIVFACGSEFVRQGSTIVDCGASRGEAIAPFVAALQGDGRFVCLEASEPMAKALRQRFAVGCAEGSVEVHQQDMRDFYPDVQADLTLAVLTLQFIPIEHRQRIMRQIYDHTAPGGALVLVEKVLGSDSDLNNLMVKLYHQLKMQNGYSPEDIDRKALSLEGVLVPVTADWNVELLRQAGFHRIDCFWRWMNFGGWIAVKSA